MVGAVDYGPFAYIGMMAVHQSLQGRGIGRALMEHLLAWLDGRGCPMALLDASPAGALLYPQLGFVDDDHTDVWAIPPDATPAFSPQGSTGEEQGLQVQSFHLKDIPEVAAFDAPIFGANRAGVLRAFLPAFAERALVVREKDGRGVGIFDRPVAPDRTLGRVGRPRRPKRCLPRRSLSLTMMALP